ncbi:hypothetical protein GE09DRAFT_690692 [Coniochaeta sp. 2T2.1]|nr:hypothetical protein GE09DRAFT_690692 [Coniochaeta sp. 2T2.1]
MTWQTASFSALSAAVLIGSSFLLAQSSNMFNTGCTAPDTSTYSTWEPPPPAGHGIFVQTHISITITEVSESDEPTAAVTASITSDGCHPSTSEACSTSEEGASYSIRPFRKLQVVYVLRRIFLSAVLTLLFLNVSSFAGSRRELKHVDWLEGFTAPIQDSDPNYAAAAATAGLPVRGPELWSAFREAVEALEHRAED